MVNVYGLLSFLMFFVVAQTEKSIFQEFTQGRTNVVRQRLVRTRWCRDAEEPLSKHNSKLRDKLTAPQEIRHIETQEGSTAVLRCSLDTFGDGTISWVQWNGYNILTVGNQIYTGDERIKVIHTQHSLDWTLQIRQLTLTDAGVYECQISSNPPRSKFYNITVIRATAKIVGNGEIFIKRGSVIKLSCVIRDATGPASYIFWFQSGRMVNFDSDSRKSVIMGRNSSQLTIHDAKSTDSGNYTCQPSNARSGSITVHVLSDEKPAEMQRELSAGTRSATHELLILFATIQIVMTNFVWTRM